MMKHIICVLFAFALALPCLADDKKVSNPGVIGNVMSFGAKKHYTAVVDKTQKMIFMIQIDGDTQTVLDSAPIMTGRSDGSKLAQDDGKTPEGIYYLIEHMTDKQMLARFGEYGKIYGIAAYPTNYPNPIDKIMRRTGYGIWLHGLAPDRSKPATEGCVALHNEDLSRVMPLFYLGMPVVIIDNAQFMSDKEYKQTKEKHLDELNKFVKAWNSADYETFKAYVHPQYSSYAGANATEFLAKKKQLMALYPEKQIKIENINIYRQNTTTLVYDFNQFYCADNLMSYGNKRFYLVYDNDSEKLISEEMKSYPIQNYLDPEIKRFVEGWKVAWKDKNVEGYLAYYDKSFPALAKWEEAKRTLFAQPGEILVNISDVRWELLGGNRIRVSFIQDYQSAITSDRGVKTLIISGCPGNYTIKSENWRAI